MIVMYKYNALQRISKVCFVSKFQMINHDFIGSRFTYVTNISIKIDKCYTSSSIILNFLIFRWRNWGSENLQDLTQLSQLAAKSGPSSTCSVLYSTEPLLWAIDYNSMKIHVYGRFFYNFLEDTWLIVHTAMVLIMPLIFGALNIHYQHCPFTNIYELLIISLLY